MRAFFVLCIFHLGFGYTVSLFEIKGAYQDTEVLLGPEYPFHRSRIRPTLNGEEKTQAASIDPLK